MGLPDSVDVVTIDAHIELLRAEIERLKQYSYAWARDRARQYARIIETLTTVRRQVQMTGMNGKRLDQEAIDAVPTLKGKHALVLYFQDEEGRKEAAQMLELAFKDQRLVRTVQL